MLCTENEVCTWPSDSCITVLRMKSADYKCRKKEWNELKKLSIHGDGAHRGLTPSFVNLVSIEEKCNGDQLDVCAVPISPWEQDSVTSFSISEDDWGMPHRSLSSSQIKLECDSGIERCSKLMLKKSTSLPDLIENINSTNIHSDIDGNSKIKNFDVGHHSCLCPNHNTRSGEESYLNGECRIKFDGEECGFNRECNEVEITDRNSTMVLTEQNQTQNGDEIPQDETSELLQEREDTPALAPIYLLIRSCFPFLFRSRINLRN